MARQILAGSIDVSVVIRIVDATDGTPETGVVFNTAGIALDYRRELAASVAITEATLAALTTAHADGGFLHIGNGYYRLDLPDAACAAGATGVLVHGTVTGMVVIGEYIELIAYNPYDAANLGLSTLSTLLSRIVGTLATGTHQPQSGDSFTRLGAPVGASHSADVAAVQADTDNLQTRLPTSLVSGRIDAHVGSVADTVLTAAKFAAGAFDAVWAVADRQLTAFSTALALSVWHVLEAAIVTASSIGLKVKTNLDALVSTRASQTSVDDLPTNAELATALAGSDDVMLAAIAVVQADTDNLQTRLPTVLVGGRIDASVGEMATDTLTNTALAASAVTEIQSGLATAAAVTTVQADVDDLQSRLPTALVNGRMVADVEAINDSPEAAQDLRFSASTIVRGAAVAGTLSPTQMTTDLTETTDDHYKGRLVIWTSGVLKDEATDVTAYLGSTKQLTYTATATGESPGVGDTFCIV